MKPNRVRLKPETRREQILTAAVEVAREHGYLHMTRGQVARRAGVSTGLVTRYFDAMPLLRRDVMRRAVREKDLILIGQGLASGDPLARNADEELKRAAIEAI